MNLPLRKLAIAAKNPHLIPRWTARKLRQARSRVRRLRTAITNSWRRRGGLSVIVPVHNAGEYLDECLQSIWKQSLKSVRVIAIDDGSSDNSAEILEEHKRSYGKRLTIVSQDNKGPGAARNAGIRRSRSKYLTFVDADDTLPRDALKTLLDALISSGSDFVVGATWRLRDGKLSIGAVDRKLHEVDRFGETIRTFPDIIYDCITANKLYRSSFWTKNIGYFPENIIYEDQIVSAKAYLRARAFDVLAAQTYLWRLRPDRSSITQSINAESNLRDRLSVQREVAQLIGAIQCPPVKEAWLKRRILGHDVKLYASTVSRMSDSHYGVLRDWVHEILGDEGWRFGRDGDVLGPAYSWLILNAQRADVEATVEALAASGGTYHTSLQGDRIVAELPIEKNLRALMPSEIFTIPIGSEQVDLRAGIRNMAWLANTVLKISGWAYISLLDPSEVETKITVVLRDAVSDSEHRFGVEPNHQLPVTETGKTRWFPYDLSGFDCQIDVASLLRGVADTARTGVVARWVVSVEVTAGPVFRAGTFRRPGAQGGARSPLSSEGTQGLVIAPVWDGSDLVLEVIRKAVTVRELRVSSGRLLLEGAVHNPDVTSVSLARSNGSAPVLGCSRLEIRGDRSFSAEVQLPAPDVSDDLAETWAIRAHASGATFPLHWKRAPGSGPDLLADGLSVHRSRRGNISVSKNRKIAEIVDISVTPRHISVRLAFTYPAVSSAHLESNQFRIPAHQLSAEGGYLTASFARDQALRSSTPLPLPIGRYELALEIVDPGSRSSVVLRPIVGPSLAQSFPLDLTDQGLRFWTTAKGLFRMQVRGQRTHDEIGPYHQARLQRDIYAKARLNPRRHAVLFESFQGHYATCNPLAISDELQRRKTGLGIYWSVTDLSVPVPEGTIPLVRLSEAWYEALAECKYVVNNNTWPAFFRKADGQVLLQTWHGTPLKRICHDFNDHFLPDYQRYLTMLDRESASWDYLISPNGFSSPVFRGAFAYNGEILETGYPRNDAIVRADSSRRERVRSSYGIPEDTKVVLYAPTWRANVFVGQPGRYKRVLYLDSTRAGEALGKDYIILVRGHSKTFAHGMSAVGSNVVDVTDYPDINDLYLASDVLVTDYSSVMFDFAITQKPILFLTPDLVSYRDVIRGFYFDFDEVAPGPLLNTTDEVVEALQNLDALSVQYQRRYEAFRSKFTSLEDGGASSRVVEAVFGDDAPDTGA